MVNVTQCRTAANIGDLLDWVNANIVHPGQVDDQTVVDRAESRNTVPAAADRQIKTAVAGTNDCSHHIR